MNACLIKLFTFIIACVVSLSSAFAQQHRQLVVKKINASVGVDAKEVPDLLDRNLVEYQPIDQVNWKKFSYKPEVKFRIAHTGKEVLLHYKVTEQSVRAMAGDDNGPVWEDACVEFFVSPTGDSCYYNFECNCTGKLLIQGGPVGDRPLAGKEVLEKVKRWTSLGSGIFEERMGMCTWEVALVIPVEAFFRQQLTSLDGCMMRGNFYKCGDKLSVPHYLSWSPIVLPRPRFHSPQFFGLLKCE